MRIARTLSAGVRILLACLCIGWTGAAQAAAAEQPAQLVVHLLDYIARDYAGAVRAGAVRSANEYKEMQEFSAQVAERVESLPQNDDRSAMESESRRLVGLVAAKADAAAVAAQASRLRSILIAAYGLPVAPDKPPSLREGEALYKANCTSCHGAQGGGDGPSAVGLDPRPANFRDRERMQGRSLYGLYNAISLGVPGTAMSGFPRLTEEGRWALAFYIAGLGVAPQDSQRAEQAWRSTGPEDPARKALADLRALATLTPAEVRSHYGEKGLLLQDYLLAHPRQITPGKPDPIVLARSKLQQSLSAYERDDRAAAMEFAISAYLDGFELAESGLDNVDHDLRLELEREMMDLRGALAAHASPDAVHARIGHIDLLLGRANEMLSGAGLSRASAFFSASVILLREGLEAILLLSAIIALVAKAGRRGIMRWVHAGWVAALVLGALTWFVAQFLVDISGASRELTEGVTALVAAAMLLYVGFWLHGKSRSQAWFHFLRHQVGAALEKRTVWAMASLSFLAVYRELFEVVLFYQALWAQSAGGGHSAVLAGVAASAVVLGALGWAIFRYSVRLPLGPFFRVMLGLVLLFAFVFAGDGIAKLQEAGTLRASSVRFIAVPVLGIHPTLETLAAQLAVVALIALSYWVLRRRDRFADRRGLSRTG